MIEVSSLVADRYRIDARIGGGGMADVFEARDEALDRDVAIKLLRGIDDPAAARRFAEEIRLTARLNHRNVVQLFDAGEHDGSPFLVLERVTGGTLSQAMGDGPLASERVAEIGRQTAAALEHAHAEGIVHRDVKPSNILLTAEGTVRLADFGIALTATATRLTVAGSVAGSAGYVSPEQVLGTGAGAASDVYALGLVLLECLTGAPPWTGTTVEVALARITADPPIPQTVPPSWRGLLTAMTTRRPEQRPPMGAVAAALAELASGAETSRFPLPVPARQPRRRRVPLVAAAALLLVGAGAVLTLDAPATPDATPVPAPAAVAPDGVIAASAVEGADVDEASPAAAAKAETKPPRQKRREAEAAPAQAPRTGSAADTADSAPSSSAASPAGGSASGPARSQRATSPKRETTADAPKRNKTTTGGGSAGSAPAGADNDSGTNAGADTGSDGGTTSADPAPDSDGEVAETGKTNKGRGNANAAKERGPKLTDDRINGVGVGLTK